MNKIFVVYWSGTGNTEKMAKMIGEGVLSEGKEAEVVEVTAIKAEMLKEIPVFALGCPSMGAEELEEEYMEPFVAEVEKYAQGKRIGLFGSYGWGECEWMSDWEERFISAGAEIVNGKGVTVLGEPDKETLDRCYQLGKSLAL
ncbi:flavodoxin [Anaerocolumna sp. MB42-C2]|uniref:flavodoxin n=1 Tax=Anaerocolumna sp. MB42-C2 TaxID=3070997 RepID=UPI0027E0C65B|nr:flavodoxin [Anaerocolumna sp. MB42-C2]WMJ89885.1 flavodoxin [Anaerocolumna sp. MB42-C2]